ncbi:MAG: hypothetical protein RLZZ490_505 [Cyanobacteriota bacterium]|jgi:hypothetical protein
MKRLAPRSRNHLPQQNLDSFLDIMTNTVGVLMFIGLFMTLVTVESAGIIKTPLSRPTKKIARLFELRGDRLHYVDTDKVQRALEGQFQGLATCREPIKPSGQSVTVYNDYLKQLSDYQNCIAQQGARLNQTSLDTNDYQVSIVNLNNLSIRYELKQGEEVGDRLSNLTKQDSKYQQQLANFDPRFEYLAFLVRPDSFQSFRQAREIAWQQGFDVGWEPLTDDTPIILGNEGRSIGVQ